MELVLKPVTADVNYFASFKEPIIFLDDKDNLRPDLVKKILKTFELRLNDIKFNNQLPSNDYIHFYKFFGQCILDVSLGLEEVAARIGTPLNEEQVADLLSRLTKIIEDYPITFQRIGIQRHLETAGDVEKYLESLNPNVPDNLQKYLSGRGVIYNFRLPDHELTIQSIITNSLIVDNGIYFFTEFSFSPNKYDFDGTYKVVKTQYEFLLNELNLKIEDEGKNANT
jgi:hypothetical protein